MEQVYQAKGMSARTFHKALKVSRTIADLEGGGPIQKRHLAEAVGYRGLEEKLWRE